MYLAWMGKLPRFQELWEFSCDQLVQPRHSRSYFSSVVELHRTHIEMHGDWPRRVRKCASSVNGLLSMLLLANAVNEAGGSWQRVAGRVNRLNWGFQIYSLGEPSPSGLPHAQSSRE
jgi:hypothetical protein